MGVLVGVAGFGDLDDMTTLWTEMAAEGGKTAAQPLYWREQTNELMSRGKHIGIVAREAGRAIGFADAQIEFDAADAEYMALGRTLFVTPGARGRHVSAALMTGVLALAWRQGAKSLITHGTPSKGAFKALGMDAEHFAEYVRVRI